MLSAQTTQLQSENASLSQKVDVLRQANRQLSEQHLDVLQQKQDMHAESLRHLQAVEDAEEATRSANDLSSKAVKNALTKVADLETELQESQRQLQSDRVSLADLHAQLAESHLRQGELAGEVARLESTVSEAESRAEASNAGLVEARKLLAEDQAEKDKRVVEGLRELQDSHARVAELEARCERLNIDLQSAGIECNVLKSQLDHLQEERLNYESQVRQDQSALAAAQEELAMCRLEVDAAIRRKDKQYLHDGQQWREKEARLHQRVEEVEALLSASQNECKVRLRTE